MHASKMFYYTYNIIIYDAFPGFSECSEFKQQVKSTRFTEFEVDILICCGDIDFY